MSATYARYVQGVPCDVSPSLVDECPLLGMCEEEQLECLIDPPLHNIKPNALPDPQLSFCSPVHHIVAAA